MNKFVLAIFISMVLSISLLMAENEASPDYAAALRKYEASYDKGIRHPDLYYNIGVCYYHLNDMASAKVNFLRTLRLNSAHKKAQLNIAFIRQMSPDKDLYPEPQFIQSLVFRLYNWFNLNRLALAILAFLLSSSLCLRWLLHYDPQKEKGLPVLILSVSVLMLCCFIGLATVKSYRLNHYNKAVIARDNTPLLDEPNLQATSSRSVSAALMVIEKQKVGDYSRIILPDGTGAWVSNDALLRVVTGN